MSARPLRGRREAPIDPITIVTAAYRPDDDDRAWLEGVLAACAPSLERGLGVYAHYFSWDTMRPESLVAVDPMPDFERVFAAWTDMLGPDLLRFSCHNNCMTLSMLFPRLPREAQPRAEASLNATAAAVRENFGLLGIDPGGRSLCITAPWPEARRLSPRERQRWLRVAAHLGSAVRLRARPRPPLDRAAAVLDPRGKTLDAEPALTSRRAREAMRRAVIAIDKAARLARQGDDDALEIWRALLDGTWSLVDHADSDGRRYFVVRRNDPRPPGPELLSPRERQVAAYAALGHANKLIAYELGISITTVATHLARAAAKLGVSSRLELIMRLGAPPSYK